VKVYKERSEEEREHFDEIVASLPENMPRVEIDESGVVEEMVKEKGKSVRGVKIEMRVSGRRTKRTNVIGAKVDGKHIGILTFKQTINSDVFEAWFEWWLLPQLSKGSAIFMDNAPFHRKSVLYEIAHRLGFILIFLPPYSPDKNSIEHSWANMKRWLRSHSNKFLSVADAIYYYFDSITDSA